MVVQNCNTPIVASYNLGRAFVVFFLRHSSNIVAPLGNFIWTSADFKTANKISGFDAYSEPAGMNAD